MTGLEQLQSFTESAACADLEGCSGGMDKIHFTGLECGPDLLQHSIFSIIARFSSQSPVTEPDLIADLETAVELAPRNAGAWFLLGQFRWTLRQDAEGAIAALKQAVDLQTNTWYATVLGNVYRDSGDLDAAVRSYELAVRLPGHTASTWATLGDAYRAQERTALEKTIALYQDLLQKPIP